VVDGWYVSTGSYNLNLRSGRADLELELFIQCKEYGEKVRSLIQEDLKECRPVEPGRVARYRSRRSLPVFDAVVRFLIL
jgi:phosphatidylserine/phosphatidylglycerophosphate/cardiolipin synthase-like enzyme